MRLQRIAWRSKDGECTGTCMGEWQGGNHVAADQFVSVMVDGSQRVIHKVYRRDVIVLSSVIDPSYGNKKPTEYHWKLGYWPPEVVL